jgi:hypothetical protein
MVGAALPASASSNLGDLRNAMLRGNRLGRRAVDVIDGDERRTGMGCDIGGMHATDAIAAKDGDFQHWRLPWSEFLQ